MIPKIIHYCWFGNNPKDPKSLECIETWKKTLPDYQIKEWSEKDLEHINNIYVEEAYQSKKWAFVSDYFRLYALSQEGGIYFDTDVEVKKSLDEFLDLDFFIGSEQYGKSKHIGTAVIGAQKGSPIIKKLLSVYDDIHFIKKDGSFDMTPNTVRLVKPLKEYGFEKVFTDSEPIYLNDKNVIFPTNYFSKECATSYTVHHFLSSWTDSVVKKNEWHFNLFGNKYAIYRYKIQKPQDFKYPESMSKKLLDWNYKKKYKLLIGRENQIFQGPIDLVYLWVDGNDVEWQKSKQYWQEKENITNDSAINPCRFIDNEELRYSLRSAEMFAPWIQKIFIVTNGQVPKWLDTSHPKIQIVTHDEIMPKEALPTFNSMAIETCLDNIPDLSEHFLFANDDAFFDKPVSKDYFFTQKGTPISYLKKHKEWNREILENNIYLHCINKTVKLTDKKFLLYEGTHCICAYTKNNLKECKKEFKEQFDKTTFSKFRSFKDIQRHIYDFWAIKNKKALGLFFKNKKKARQLYLNIMNSNCMFQKLKKNNPILVCYNDSEKTTQTDRENLKYFLNNRYSQKQEWEI
ncbi:MAG: Stealth CR1 domain-containing protein [Alphaproteobacteria bacterium]|nr:Stealth CR1 domain-containing protein [Alphaproteobacteria bacterium]